MSEQQLKQLIGSLAQSQGFYGRLYEALEQNGDWWQLKDELDRHGKIDPIDVITYIESGV